MKSAGYQSCSHCGQPHREGEAYRIIIAGKKQSMCCPGCQVVASLLADYQAGKTAGQDIAVSPRPQTGKTRQ